MVAAAGLWLWLIKLPRAVMPRLWVDRFPFLRAKCTGVPVPGRMACVHLVFQETARFLQSSCPPPRSHQPWVRDLSPCVLADVCIVATFKFCINILVSRWPCLVGALICISLMANDVGCLCRCAFAIRLSLVKCLFMSLTHFLIGLFSFLLSSFECSYAF